MSEPIKVGDLVMVVGASACACALGHIFQVVDIAESYAGEWSCDDCGAKWNRPSVTVGHINADYAEELAHLKRIPPLSELESEKNKEELTA